MKQEELVEVYRAIGIIVRAANKSERTAQEIWGAVIDIAAQDNWELHISAIEDKLDIMNWDLYVPCNRHYSAAMEDWTAHIDPNRATDETC